MKDEIAVVETPRQSPSLFNSSSPSMIIEEATDIANQLSDIIKTKKLYKPIGAKSHVFVEGWTTLGALLGVFPYPESSVRLDREDEIAYEASVVVRTLDGVEVSKGEAICSSKEANWRNSDEYAIKSMATTRATSKAMRIPLGWVMVLAGYSATPAEEMMGKGFTQPRTSQRVQQPAPANKKRVVNKPQSSGRPKSSNRPKSSQPKPVDSEFDETMPESEKVQNPKDDTSEDVQDGDITPTNWEALRFENETYAKVLDQFSEGETVNAQNIRRKAKDMVGEQLLTPDEKQEVYQFLRGK